MKVAIIMGSDSDLGVMAAAKEVLDELEVESFMTVVSAHRTPNRLYEFAQNARDNGYAAIIAGAGGAAHLPGMVASLTPLPVIGVPVSATKLAGNDALLSIVQMPAGVPVATVAIDGARNAGILAAQIVGVANPDVLDRIQDMKHAMADASLAKAERVESNRLDG